MAKERELNFDNRKVGYVLKRFPRLTETFILNELLELESQGVALEVFSLMHPPQEMRHKMLSTLKASVTYLPRPGILSKLKLATGQEDPPTALTMPEALGGCVPMSELFPGKDADQATHLCIQATTLALLARSKGVDHFHAHFASNATTVAMLASRMTKIPYSFTAHARDIYHEYVDPDIDNELRRKKIIEAKFVATVSDYNVDYLRSLLPRRYKNKVIRIYNGINLSRFQPIDPRHAPKVLAVGRLVEKKGFQHLINACAHLRREVPNLQCRIVGDGPERESLEHQIKARGIADCVELVGFKSQESLMALMKDTTVFVLPCVVAKSGDRDGLPTVLLEALAMGIPVVSTRVAGVPEIITDGDTGILVEPGDCEALAKAINEILSNRTLREHFSKNERRKAKRCFDLKRNVELLKQQFDLTSKPNYQQVNSDAHRIYYGG